jgi:hypothetical protein
MSNSKNAIVEIKKLMKQFGFMSNEPLMKSFKIQDNTILETIDLKVGESITKINENFERVALDNGSYRLLENFKIRVKDGKITSVKKIFMEEKLIDGTEIMIEGDELEEGARVKVITEEMSEEGIVAPDGVHELEDGTKIETKEGVIVKIEEVVSEEMEEVEVPVEVPAEIAPVAEEVVGAIIEALMPLMEEVKVLVEEMKKMKDKMGGMQNDFETFKKAPAGEKIKDGKTEFNNMSDSSDIASTIMALRKLNK